MSPGHVGAKDGFPPGEAIRAPARPSIAFDPSERLKTTLSGHSAWIL
jgi:hypothetical protein